MGKKETYNRIARFYDLLDIPFEYGRYRRIRQILFAGLNGTLLDAGVGTGSNFPYYPKDSNVTGIDLSPAMIDRAQWRSDKFELSVNLFEMDVLALSFTDDSFDSIVATFLFCVLDSPYQQRALEELRRVCKPNGTIHILEYAYSKEPLRRFIMKLWAPWVRFAYGAEFDRKTEQYIDVAGLKLVEAKFLYKDIIKLLKVKPKTMD